MEEEKVRKARQGGLCCTTAGAMGFWFAIFTMVFGSLLLLRQAIPGLAPYASELLLAAGGVACVANVVRNRVFHCAITGPVFLLIAGALALDTGGVWNLPTAAVWPVLLIVIGIALLLEQRFAYRPPQA